MIKDIKPYLFPGVDEKKFVASGGLANVARFTQINLGRQNL